MNIAIPIFGNRVSPRFDSAPAILLVRANGESVEERSERSVKDVQGWRRAGLLLGDGVDVLLCGGIRQSDYFSIVSHGIDVYPGLIGEVDDVLDAFLAGRLTKDGFCGGLVPVGPRRERRRMGRCCEDDGSGRRGARNGAGRGFGRSGRRGGSRGNGRIQNS